MSIDLNSRLLRALRGRYAGRRCFLIGNGPSLRPEDLDRIHAQGDISLASNRVYLIFEKTVWRPTFFLIEDTLIARASGGEISRHFSGNVLYADYIAEHIEPPAGYASFRLLSRVSPPELPAFAEDFVEGAHGGGTITYTALQFARWLGIREVYLLGVDFRYSVPEPRPSAEFAGLQEFTSKGEVNHFAGNYVKAGEVLPAPDIQGSLCSYRAAWRKTQEVDDFQIFNATRGGCLEVFPRVDFDTLFDGERSPDAVSPGGLGLAVARSAWEEERRRADAALALLETFTGTVVSERPTCFIADLLGEARFEALGQWGATSVGSVRVGDVESRTVLLHPPARLGVQLPEGVHGTLLLAVGMHPEVWQNPESGPCRFIVRLDDRVLLDTTVDIRKGGAAHGWHAFKLRVPPREGAKGYLEFETQGVGGEGYRWALWRDPVILCDP